MSEYRLSFQLYSARNFPPLEAQLEKLAEIGYDAIEPFSDLYEADPVAFRGMADSFGLPMPSVLSTLALMDRDADDAIDMARTLGARTIVLPYIFPEDRPTDFDGWKAIARRISDHADRAAEAGLALAWHNHDFEYAPLPDGTRPIDLILDGRNVGWEPDVGWLVRAGLSPEEELRRYLDRIRVFHIKDTAPEGVTAEGGWAAVGSGIINWKALWPTIASAETNLLVVEHDDPADWRAFATDSFTFLRQLTSRSN